MEFRASGGFGVSGGLCETALSGSGSPDSTSPQTCDPEPYMPRRPDTSPLLSLPAGEGFGS